MNQYLHKKLTATGMLVFISAIFSGLLGLDTRQTFSFQIFSLLLSMILIGLIATLIFRGRFSMQRQLPNYCTAEQPLKYRIRINNHTSTTHKNLSLIEELEYNIPDPKEFKEYKNRHPAQSFLDRCFGFRRWKKLVQLKQGALVKSTSLGSLQSQGYYEGYVSILPKRRGYLHFKSSILLKPDPIGLINACKIMQHSDKLLVLPKRYKTATISLPATYKYQPEGTNYSSGIGHSQEFFSLRDYQHGDPIRNIHWRSFAKLSRPIVKEHQDEFFVRTKLILDTFIEDQNDLIFEEAISVAASLIDSSTSQDNPLDFLFFEKEIHNFIYEKGNANLVYILQVMACIDSCRDQSFQVLAKFILRCAQPQTAMICIFLNWGKSRQDFIEQLQKIGVPVIVIVIAASNEIKYEAGPMHKKLNYFHVLHAGNIETELININF